MRLAPALLALLAAGCGSEPVTLDAGTPDAGTPDAGPLEAPSRPGLSGQVLDRAGRPFVGRLLVGATATTAAARAAARAAYDQLEPQPYFPGDAPLSLGTTADPRPARFLMAAVAAFDGLDGRCGSGPLVREGQQPGDIYRDLAGLLADDRIWVDTSTPGAACDVYLAAERRALGIFGDPPAGDCGGRRPGLDVVDPTLRLLTGLETSDGVDADDADTSTTSPPFFAEP